MNSDMDPIPLETLLSHVDGMRRLAHRLVLDPALAEDVAQDAVLVALAKGPRHRRNVRGWLHGIVRNMARDARRKAGRRARHEGAVPTHKESPDPLSRAVQLAEQKRLLDAVESLAEPYREAIWQRYFENRTPRAIAKDLGVSVETIHTRLKRARAMLRTRLDRTHDGDRRAWALALAPLAASDTAWALPTLIGGALVTTKTKMGVLAALVLLAAGAVVWMIGADSDPNRLSGTEGDRAASAGPGDASQAAELRGRPNATAKPLPPLEEGTVRVRGICLDGAERPLADVELRVGPLDEDTFGALRIAARSRGDGTFSFVTGEEPQRLVGHAAGRLDAAVRVDAGKHERLVLRLPSAPHYVYRLLDGETDAPLAGVRCEIRRTLGHRAYTRAVYTDERGLVTMPSPTADELERFFAVRIAHPGYRPVLQLERPSPGSGYGSIARPRDVYLFPAPRLVIQVRDEDGRAVEGARVQAWAGQPTASTLEPEWRMSTIRTWSDGAGNGVALGETRSNPQGRAELRVGPAHLHWWACASTGDRVGFVYGGDPHRNRDVTKTVTLHPTLRITGRVKDTAGNALARARVEFTPAFMHAAMKKGGFRIPPDEILRRFRSTSDEQGRYELRGLPSASPPAKMYLMAHRGDLGFASKTVEAPARGEATLAVDLVIEREYDVQALRVVDADGKPIARALVTFANMLPGMLTDADGRARLVRYPLAKGHQGPYRAFKDGYMIGTAEPSGTDEELEIVLTRGLSLAGRVVDKEGEPRGAYVDVYHPDVAELPEQERNQLFTARWYGRAHADRNGRFRVDELPPGPYFVRFWYSTKRAGKHHVVLGEQMVEGNDPLELRLPEVEPPTEPTGTVEGTVYDAKGAIVTEYWLSLQGPGGSGGPDLRGRRFRFESAAVGTWKLKASTESGANRTELTVVVRAGETTRVRVVMGRSITVRGRLVNESGKGIGRTYVQLFREGEYSYAGFRGTDTDGRFEMKSLLPGRYRARVRFHGDEPPYAASDEFFEVAADQQEEIVIRARPAGTLTLELEDDRFLTHSKGWHAKSGTARGRRSWFSRVEVRTSEGETLRDVGLFHGRKTFVYPLAAGNYDLEVKTMKEGSFRTSFSVTAGEDTVVPVLLQK